MSNSGLNILITGASSGIGEALALYYAASGAKNLFICGRNQERLNDVKARCEKSGAKVYAEIMNVSEREKVEQWVEKSNLIAPLDMVFANAGVSTGEETPENIFNTFDVNVIGTINTVVPAAEIFKNRQDKKTKTIVITSSIAGYHGLPACPSYSAGKACIKAYGEAIRPVLKEYGINVCVVCPGFVKSRITDKNTCPMPFFMSAEKAAEIIAERVEKNVGLIAFPWPMRLAVWALSVLPNRVSEFIYARLPHKV